MVGQKRGICPIDISGELNMSFDMLRILGVMLVGLTFLATIVIAARQEDQSTQSESRQEIQDVRQEIQDVRQEIRDVRQEIKADLRQVQTEIEQENEKTREEIKIGINRVVDSLSHHEHDSTGEVIFRSPTKLEYSMVPCRNMQHCFSH